MHNYNYAALSAFGIDNNYLLIVATMKMPHVHGSSITMRKKFHLHAMFEFIMFVMFITSPGNILLLTTLCNELSECIIM